MSICRQEQGDDALRLRVAVIDDEPLILSLICELLDEGGHDVACFTSATAALPALRAANFDVVLCDINMPEMTGIEFYERVSVTLPEYSHRIALLTGDPFAPATQSFLIRTGCLYLSKPFRRAALESVLAALAMPGVLRSKPDELRQAA